MHLYFDKNGDFIAIANKSSRTDGANPAWLDANWEGKIKKAHPSLKKSDIQEYIVPDNKTNLKKMDKILKGYIPKLEDGELTSMSTWTKSEWLQQKEAKLQEKETKETRKAELLTKLEEDTITEAELKEAVKLLLKK